MKLIPVKSTELELFLLCSLIENPLNGTRDHADTNLDKLVQYRVDDTAPMMGAATFVFLHNEEVYLWIMLQNRQRA